VGPPIRMTISLPGAPFVTFQLAECVPVLMKCAVTLLGLVLSCLLQAQVEEAKNLVSQIPTAQGAKRLLELTQKGDRPARLFLLERWSTIGPEAVGQVERVHACFDPNSESPFVQDLIRTLADVALGQDKQAAKLAIRSLAYFSAGSELSRFTASSVPGCGVVALRRIVAISRKAMGEVVEKRPSLAKECIAKADIPTLLGFEEAARGFERPLIARRARAFAFEPGEYRTTALYLLIVSEKKLDAPIWRHAVETSSEPERSWLQIWVNGKDIVELYGGDAGKWPAHARRLYAFRPPRSYDSRIGSVLQQDPDPNVSSLAVFQWGRYRYQDPATQRIISQSSEGRAIYDFILWLRRQPDGFTRMVELAKNGSLEFLYTVLYEADTRDQADFALKALGNQLLREGVGQEDLFLARYWPQSKAHMDQMLASARFESRFVAAYVLTHLAREKLSPEELSFYLDRIAEDKEAMVAGLCLKDFIDKKHVEKALENIYALGDIKAAIKGISLLDKSSSVLTRFAASKEEALAEYARAILKSKATSSKR
jgi:hypothetical protein